MAVAKMKLVSIIGKMDSLDNVLEKCCETGEFQIDQAISFFSSVKTFSPLNEENPYEPYYESLKVALLNARLSLEKGADTDILTDWEETKKYVQDISGALSALQNERKNVLSRVEALRHSHEQFDHFLGLDLKLDEIFACEYIKVRFGRLPKESFEKLKTFTKNPYIIYFPCTNDMKYVWGVYFSPIEVIDETDRIFASLYFERLRIPDAVGTPHEAVEGIEKEMSELGARLEEIDRETDEIWELEKQKCSKVFAYLDERRNAFDLRRYAARYGDSFIVAGWLPADREKKFHQIFDPMDGVDFEVEDAKNEILHTPPVKLKNKKPFRPFEFLVEMYGLPNYNEVDPTPFVAITYFLTFGIMFADLGQGIVLSLIGWFIMWKMKKMPLGKIVAVCGVSSALFGFVFGSFFGLEHALDGIWGQVGSLFNITFEHGKPIEVMHSMMETILAAVAIGVVLLVCAICINIYSSIKRKDYGSALFGPNGAAGLVFYVSVIAGVVAQLALGIKLMTLPYILFLIILPILILAFYEPLCHKLEGREDWLPKKWGGYLTQTFFELFEYMLSYVSNTLSFMRVGAFVFVHVGMMSAVMMIGSITEGTPLTASNIVILIIGNIIVMGMEGLLVGIQTLRLQFCELFSRYFKGDGKPFKPIRLKKK